MIRATRRTGQSVPPLGRRVAPRQHRATRIQQVGRRLVGEAVVDPSSEAMMLDEPVAADR
jgi:hypothetical protein